jgi:uncharacterized protein YdiU (UPF0061 family)
MRFDNHFVRTLPGDPILDNRVRQVRGAAYSFVTPTPVSEPKALAFNAALAQQLGVPTPLTDEWLEVLAGNRVLPGMEPYAACYGGHQFGTWAGQLGDGRAVTLCEMVSDSGERFELQLKGPGPTPYSRRGDGRAVLRSSLREYVASEAMFHLGVPTTRALSLVVTADTVERDLLYDGNQRPEPLALTTRIAPSFLRFGSFELPSTREELELLERLVAFTVRSLFQGVVTSGPRESIALFEEVVRRTARLMTEWQRVGFVHGVMNTDNMSVLGLTIDYGPFGWLEGFDPEWTPNTTDLPGRRYAFGNQPEVAQWNLMCLANALFPLVNDASPFENALKAYADVTASEQLAMMRKKLGLSPRLDDETSDWRLLTELFRTLLLSETDMTLFFRQLERVTPQQRTTPDEVLVAPLEDAFYAPPDDSVVQAWAQWLRAYLERVERDTASPAQRTAVMNATNPLYVPRNYLAHTVIGACERGDAALLQEWLEVLRTPYLEKPGKEEWARKRPSWARNQPGTSMLSCSS